MHKPYPELSETTTRVAQVIEQEESYTSKCSFLDLEPIQAQKVYAGERIARGLRHSSRSCVQIR